jgi:prevent-host-death family protein
MTNEWQLQNAKNRLSRVVDEAIENGPQTITLRGKPAVVVVSVEEYRRLCGAEGSLFEFLAGSPLRGVPLDLARGRDAGRDVKL